MAYPRKINGGQVISIDGQIIGTGAANFTYGLSRDRIEREEYEQPGKLADKGDWKAPVKLTDSWGTQNEAKLLAQLADSSESSSVLFLIDSNSKLSPMALPGDPALWGNYITADAPQTATKNALKKLSASFELADGQAPNLGKTLFTSRAATPAPLTHAGGTGGVYVSTPVNLGALVAGKLLAITVHCHSITGTGVVTLQVEVLHDAAGGAGFTTPIVSATGWVLWTNENPPSGGRLLAPKAQSIVLDGDATPLAGETWWAVRLTVLDSLSDGKVEATAAANLLSK